MQSPSPTRAGQGGLCVRAKHIVQTREHLLDVVVILFKITGTHSELRLNIENPNFWVSFVDLSHDIHIIQETKDC